MCKKIAIVAPCYNEGITIKKFLDLLQQVLSQERDYNFEIIVVDDGSNDGETNRILESYAFTTPHLKYTYLKLKFNVGHQAAIYQGLVYTQQTDAERIIVMDSDGEDAPEAVGQLLKRHSEIVHVVRGKRKEKMLFILMYKVYRLMFVLITGKVLNFGNYCCISAAVRDIVVQNNFIHFAAFLSKQKIKSETIVFDRALRLDGKSKMNLTTLIHHAFKSYVEYAENFLMIFLKVFLLLGVIVVFFIIYVLHEKLFTNDAILGWASTMILGLTTMMLISLGFFVLGVLLLNLSKRQTKQPITRLFAVVKRNAAQKPDVGAATEAKNF